MPAPEVAEPLEIIVAVDGAHRSYRFEAGPVVIGRHADCDIVLDDARISRHHARACYENGTWILRDNGSTNGIHDGDQLVESLELVGTHELQIGEIPVTFQVGASPLSETATIDSVHYAASVPLDDFDSLIEQTMTGFTPVPTAAPDAAPGVGPIQIISILKSATEAMLAHEGLDKLLETLLDLICDHLPVDRAHVLMLDEHTGELRPRARRFVAGVPPGRMHISRRIADEAIRSKQAVLVVDASEDARFDSSQSVLSLGIRSAMCVPLCDQGRVVGLIFVDRNARNAFRKEHLEMLSILAGLSAAAIDRARLQERIQRERSIRARLARYHAPAVVDRIIASSEVETQTMTAEEREVTVLFADISGFTRMSEHLPARKVTDLLNEIFQALTEEVFAESGTLDKFMGDAVMVFFGAPLTQADHAARAVRVALAMQARIAQRNTQYPPDQRIAIRIGINTGMVVVGDVGAKQRRDYTVIGDTVNTACRLESSVAEPGQVVIGHECFYQVEKLFDCRPLESVVLRGKTMTVQPYLVVGPRTTAAPQS